MGLPWVHAHLLHDRHQRLSESVERSLRCPDVEDGNALGAAEGRVIHAAARVAGAGLPQELGAFIVLRGGHRGLRSEVERESHTSTS